MEKFLGLDSDSLAILFSAFQLGDIINFSQVSSVGRTLVQGYLFPLLDPAIWEVDERAETNSFFDYDPFLEDEKACDDVTPVANFLVVALRNFRKSLFYIMREKFFEMSKVDLERHIGAFVFVCRYGFLDLAMLFIKDLRTEILAIQPISEIIRPVILSNRKEDTDMVFYLIELGQEEDKAPLYTIAFLAALERGNFALLDSFMTANNFPSLYVDRDNFHHKEFRYACALDGERAGFLADLMERLKGHLSELVLRSCVEDGVQYCAKAGLIDTFRYLVTDVIDIADVNPPCIVWMTTIGNVDTFKIFVEKGGKLDEQSNHAIMWAGRTGNLALVRYLVKFPEVRLTADNDYAYNWALRNGYSEVANYIQSVKSQ